MSHDLSASDFTPPEIEEIAELLPAYEILSFIAKGGMGAVYMARQKSLDRDVAIKILPRHFGEDAEFRASFQAEAKSMAKLNHSNLIGIYDFGQIDGMLYIIMEMVQGKSLYHSAYGKTIDPTEAGRIVASICHGLAHAHSYGILHRDIKPANILLDPKASPKIGDFGLARPVGDHEADSAFGTPGYTAPEVIHNPTAVAESTDIYSVGAILYELLTGKLPDNIYTPAATLVNCDPKFDQIIRKAMHPTPALRYRNAEDMAEAIEQIIKADKPTRGTLLHSSSKDKANGARTLLTAAPARKPELKTEIAPKDSPASPQTVSTANQVKVGSDIPFIRNIIIIIALLASIYIAWEGLKIMRAKREAENARVAEINKQQADNAEAERQRAKTARQSDRKLTNGKPPELPTGNDNSSIPSTTPPISKAETALESLARLQTQLFKGDRSEFPKGTITQGNRARFFIQERMSWHQAREFCESHGGHLAIIPLPADLRVFCSKLKSTDVIWLGAGSAGNGNWSWIDGSPWQQDIRRTSKASYVAVDDTGILDPQLGKEQHSFFIEWMTDGSSPATLENQLKRCAESITNGSPAYPAGTIAYDNRHFLLVQRNSEWQIARNLAKLAKGTLATPSNADENEWMLTFLANNLDKDQVCWIGGIRQANQSWGWATGEPWEFAKWGDGLPDEGDSTPSACTVLPNRTWDDYPVDSTAPCFLIEWSNDAQGHKAVKVTGSSTKTQDITTLRRKCATLIKDINQRYDKLYANNIKGYEQELRIFERSLPKSQQDIHGPTLREIMSSHAKNRIPGDIEAYKLPEKAVSIHASRLKRHQDIENKHLSEIEDLREKYRRNLFKMAKELKEKGLTSRLRAVQAEIDGSSSEGHHFAEHILGLQ